jgi:hypothetical protein
MAWPKRVKFPHKLTDIGHIAMKFHAKAVTTD